MKAFEQLQRTERWFSRLKEIHSGREHNRESDYYEDILYTFFQNCFHLKDWIIASGVCSKKTVDAFINENEEMKICRDLCNGSKHLTIKQPSVDSDIKVKNREFSLHLGKGDPEIKVIYWIEVNGTLHEGFCLAERCLSLWKNFFDENT